MVNEPVMRAPLMLCRYCQPAQGFRIKSQKLDNPAEPSCCTAYPTGYCIHASVAMMKYPDSHEPMNTIKAVNQWARGPSRFSPNRNRPRKEDSMKKAKTPSIASVCPITPPANRENRAQLVPNWNSMGMPVTPPITKLTANIFAQNRAATL